jgi:hypothetical protein
MDKIADIYNVSYFNHHKQSVSILIYSMVIHNIFGVSNVNARNP